MVSQKTKQAFWDEVTRNGDKFRRNGRIGRRNSDGRWFLPNGQANKQMVTVTLENQLEVLADRGNTMPSAGTHVRVNRVDGAFVIEGLAVQGSNTSRPASEANIDTHNHNKGYRHFYPVDSDSLLDGGVTITPGTSNVTFKRKQYRDADGKPKIYAGGDTVDMSAYGTTLSAGQQAWVLAYIAPATGALTLYEAAGGSAPLNTTTDLDAAISDFYDNVPSGEPYRAIRVNKGAIPYSVYKPAEGYSLENKDMVRFRAVGRYTLAQLGDTDITSPTNRQVPVYNSSSSVWINDELNVGDLGDVDDSSLNQNFMIFWRSGTYTTDRFNLSYAVEFSSSPAPLDRNLLVGNGSVFVSRNLEAADIQSGTLAHERGGLEADVSDYGGVPIISGGVTSEIKYNLTATTDPDANDDSSSGYAVGSLWANTTRGRMWQCVDDTSSAAVWRFLAGQVACKASLSGSQTLSNNTLTAITLNSESLDTDNMHDNTTNNSRITVPFDGVYSISSTCVYNNNSTGFRDAQVRVNGTNIERNRTLAGGFVNINVAATAVLNSGDYVELFGFQNSGGSLDVISAHVTLAMVHGVG